MVEKQRQIDGEYITGTCPFCDSINYSREDTELQGDSLFTTCICKDCNKPFTETFYLKYQEWNDEVQPCKLDK